MDELIYLVRETYASDGIQMVPSEALVPVWAHIQSVTRAEWTLSLIHISEPTRH